MNLAQLKDQRTNLVLQRAQAKDQIENIEKALGQIGFAIQALESAEAEDPRTEMERLADEESERDRMENLD